MQFSQRLDRFGAEVFSSLNAKRLKLEAEGRTIYNLSVGTYVERRDTRERVDIAELNERIAGIVAREQELREQIDAIVADLEA